MLRLPILRCNVSDLRRKLCVTRQINLSVLDNRARRVLPEEIVTLPILRRPNRARDKTTATIGADIAQNNVSTR